MPFLLAYVTNHRLLLNIGNHFPSHDSREGESSPSTEFAETIRTTKERKPWEQDYPSTYQRAVEPPAQPSPEKASKVIATEDNPPRQAYPLLPSQNREDKSTPKYLKTREDLRLEAEAEFKRRHSFKPSLQSAPSPFRSSSNSHSRLLLSTASAASKAVQRPRAASASRSIASTQQRPVRPARSNSRGRSTSPSGNLDTSVERGKGRRRSFSSQRVEELHREHQLRLRNREKQRHDLEQLEMSECTFSPQLSRSTETILRHRQELGGSSINRSTSLTSRSGRREVEGGSGIDASLRLYREAEERSSQQKWLQRRVAEARMAQYTFQPRLHHSHSDNQLLQPSRDALGPMSASGDRTPPIFERVAELQRERRQRLQNLRASYERELQDQLPFTPQIDQKSKSIIERKYVDEEGEPISPHNDVGSRLMDAGNSIFAFHSPHPQTRPCSQPLHLFLHPSHALITLSPSIFSLHRPFSLPFDSPSHLSHFSSFLILIHTRTGRIMNRKKLQLLVERERELNEAMEQPGVSLGTQRIARSSDIVRSVTAATITVADSTMKYFFCHALARHFPIDRSGWRKGLNSKRCSVNRRS